MTTTLVIHGWGAPIDIELPDGVFDALKAYAARHQLTLDEAVEKAIGDWIASHPIIAQTRTEQ